MGDSDNRQDGLTPEDEKAAYERDIFRLFVQSADLPVLPRSIQSRPPPEPDILCQLEDGAFVAFELGELHRLHSNPARARFIPGFWWKAVSTLAPPFAPDRRVR